MNWREKLADWISGGELSLNRRASEIWEDRTHVLYGELKETESIAVDLVIVLDKIAAEEKPTSNATVKRMARMAREALK